MKLTGPGMTRAAVEVLIAFALAIAAHLCVYEWGKMRDPGGSSFPPGLAFGIGAALASVTLTWLAVRRAPRAGIIAAAVVNALVVLAFIAWLSGPLWLSGPP